MRKLLTLLLLLNTIVISAQVPVGQWREHLSYNNVQRMIEYNNQVIALTDRAIFIHDLNSGSNRRISKINGLFGVDVSALGVDSLTGITIVGYQNGYFDIINGNQITSFGDIARSNVPGDKGIYNVFFYNNLAYLCTGYGISVFNINASEIKESYFIANNGDALRVNELIVFQNKFYATTNAGIYSAEVDNNNLSDFRNWTRDLNIPNASQRFKNIEIFEGKLFTNFWSEQGGEDVIYYTEDGENWVNWRTVGGGKANSLINSNGYLLLGIGYGVNVFDKDLNRILSFTKYETDPKTINVSANDVISVKDGEILVADANEGIVKWNISDGLQEYIVPSGPIKNDAVHLSMFNDNLWIASGAVAGNWNNTFNRGGFYSFVEEQWINYSPKKVDELDNTYDYIITTLDPADPKHSWVGSWAKGLYEFRNGDLVNHYDQNNSPIEIDVNRNDAEFARISGLTYDAEGNLWISNPQCDNPLKVLTPSGTWYTFDLENELPLDYPISEIIISNAGYKWMVRPRKRGMIVFDDNGTLSNPNDDRQKIISTEVGQGELPTLSINAARLDLDGELWLGTAEGIAVFYAPDEVFDNENFKAEQILIEQDGNVQILLETEVVTSIEIDGANRKWIGTQASGVFLLSADGTEQIYHFTEENSPLPDNEIRDITLNHGKGEVYFATSDGIVSYKGTATTGFVEVEEPLVYPNPVPPGYDGVIAVKNLVAHSYFKVTDIAGNMIYEGKTEGGQAVWNGKNYNGEKVESGVYLFLITDEAGEKTTTAKVLVTK